MQIFRFTFFKNIKAGLPAFIWTFLSLNQTASVLTDQERSQQNLCQISRKKRKHTEQKRWPYACTGKEYEPSDPQNITAQSTAYGGNQHCFKTISIFFILIVFSWENTKIGIKINNIRKRFFKEFFISKNFNLK